MAFMDPQTIYLESKDIRIDPAFEQNNIAIGLFSSDAYAPYCGVLVQSIISNASPEKNYDILIMERAISLYNKQLMMRLLEGHSNISIRFINVSALSKTLKVVPHGHFSIENSIKLFFFSEFFERYKKIVSTDSDLVFETDIAKLYEVDLNDTYLAAVPDVIMKAFVSKGQPAMGEKAGMPSGEYITEYLGLKSTELYLNTGVCLFNLKKAREDQKFEQLLDLVNEHKYWFLEQDALNVCFADTAVHLDSKWNVHCSALLGWLENGTVELPQEIVDKIYEDVCAPYVWHFAGSQKPWNSPGCYCSERFFDHARMTPWYERILSVMVANMRNAKTVPLEQAVAAHYNEFQTNAWKVCIKSFLKAIVRRLLGKSRYDNLKAILRRKKDKNLKRIREEANGHIVNNIKKARVPSNEEFKNKKALQKLKGKYAGQRCFIVGTGPSLTIEDLEKLKGEITFSLNGIYKLFHKTDWRPSFYVNNDIALLHGENKERLESVTECLKNYRFEGGVFLSSSKYDREFLELCPGQNVYFLNAVCDIYQLRQPKPYYFSKNCSKKVFMHGTTMYVIAQLIRYMGFSEVYFIGTDASYTDGAFHAYQSNEADQRLYGHTKNAEQAGMRLQLGFEDLKYYLQEKGNIRVFNATRGGKLEIFPRVELENILVDISKESSK